MQHLASVGLDDHHTLNVWDWRRGKVVGSARGHSDRIFDVQFKPHSATELITCGVKHIKFWVLHGNSLSGKKGIFGKKGCCNIGCVGVVCICVAKIVACDEFL